MCVLPLLFVSFSVSSESLHAFEILPVPYPFTPWVAPKPEHRPTNFRIDDSEFLMVLIPCCWTAMVSLSLSAMSLRAQPDELVLGQMRDWNEELQTARQLPTNTSAAKVFRDRALFKVLHTADYYYYY